MRVKRRVSISADAFPVRNMSEKVLFSQLYDQCTSDKGRTDWNKFLHTWNHEADFGSPTGGPGGLSGDIFRKTKGYLQEYAQVFANEWDVHYLRTIATRNLRMQAASLPTALNRTGAAATCTGDGGFAFAHPCGAGSDGGGEPEGFDSQPNHPAGKDSASSA